MSAEAKDGRPIVVAHRGWSFIAPENTMASFKLAEELGADFFELDVHVSKEGKAVVMHDDTVDRTTNGSGKLDEMTLEELKKLDAGSWKDPKYAGEPIPTLEEVLTWLKTANIKIFIEIKDQRAVPETMKLIEESGLTDRAWLISFNFDAVMQARKLNPDVRRGFLTGEFPEKAMIASVKNSLKPTALIPNHKAILGPEIKQTHQNKMAFFAYTIDDPQRMQSLIDWGADGIITNRPNLAMALVGKEIPEKFQGEEYRREK